MCESIDLKSLDQATPMKVNQWLPMTGQGNNVGASVNVYNWYKNAGIPSEVTKYSELRPW